MTRRYRRSRTDYPKGVLSIYDNDGKTTDRYMVVYEPYECQGRNHFPVTCMSDAPFWPQGVCMHDSLPFRPTGGWETGQRVIAFEALPADCQKAVQMDLAP